MRYELTSSAGQKKRPRTKRGPSTGRKRPRWVFAKARQRHPHRKIWFCAAHNSRAFLTQSLFFSPAFHFVPDSQGGSAEKTARSPCKSRVHHVLASISAIRSASNRARIDLAGRDLCITLILAKIWEFTIDFIVKNLMKFANIELCRGLIDSINNRPVRQSATSAAAVTDLATYAAAVTAMQALPASDPRNWTKQAEIHQNFCPHGNWYFLPWHRAYL